MYCFSLISTDVWHSSVTFSNQSSPMRHELPPYSSPTSSRVSNLSSLPSPLSPTASVISPPPPYPCNRGAAYSPLYVRRGLMDYIADGRSQDDVTESNGYQDHHDTGKRSLFLSDRILKMSNFKQIYTEMSTVLMRKWKRSSFVQIFILVWASF